MADATTISLGAVTKDSSVATIDTFVVKDIVLAPVEEKHVRVLTATGAGTTVDLSTFTTVLALLITNTDGTNFVTAEIENAAAGTPATVIPALGALYTQDVDPATNIGIVADTAACFCDVLVIGT